MSKYPGDRGYTAFRLLQVAFVIAPLLAGLDKFFYMLTNWNQYLHPMAQSTLDGKVRMFFMAVGIIEIIVGLGVIFKPKVFSYIVFIWLICITLNLILGGWYDIALRDIGLALGALALAQLSHKYSN